MPVSQQMLVLTKKQSVAHAGALHVTASKQQILRPREKKNHFISWMKVSGTPSRFASGFVHY